MKHTINSIGSLKKLLAELMELFEKKKFFQIEINTGKKRTLSQNALQHVWASQVSKEEAEYTPEGVRCIWKLHIGLPILRGDDEEYNEACVRHIDNKTYEDKIDAMKYWPVTSIMKTKQLSLFLEQVQAHYVGRVKLEFPAEKELLNANT